jgi:hypothetical protein
MIQLFNKPLKIKLDKGKIFFKMLILCQYPTLLLQPIEDKFPKPNTRYQEYESI